MDTVFLLGRSHGIEFVSNVDLECLKALHGLEVGMYANPKSELNSKSVNLVLADLERQIKSIAHTIERLTVDPVESSVIPLLPPTHRHNLVLANELMSLRRECAAMFPECHFADPQFDILLDLYAANLSQRRTSVTDLGVGTAVPTTTLLRHIDIMVKQGVLTRSPDPRDGRRIFIGLSDNALGRTRELLNRATQRLEERLSEPTP